MGSNVDIAQNLGDVIVSDSIALGDGQSFKK